MKRETWEIWFLQWRHGGKYGGFVYWIFGLREISLGGALFSLAVRTRSISRVWIMEKKVIRAENNLWTARERIRKNRIRKEYAIRGNLCVSYRMFRTTYDHINDWNLENNLDNWLWKCYVLFPNFFQTFYHVNKIQILSEEECDCTNIAQNFSKLYQHNRDESHTGGFSRHE